MYLLVFLLAGKYLMENTVPSVTTSKIDVNKKQLNFLNGAIIIVPNWGRR